MSRSSVMLEIDAPDEFGTLPASEQEALTAWIKATFETSTSRGDRNTSDSYVLKHVFERSSGGFYVTNGAFKGAMQKAGFLAEDSLGKNWVYRLQRIALCDYEGSNKRGEKVPCKRKAGIESGRCVYHLYERP